MKNHGRLYILTALLLSLLLFLTACEIPQKEENETEKSTKAPKTTAAETEADVTTQAPATEPQTTAAPLSPSGEVLSEVKNGNYVKALDIYANSVSGNSREEVVVQTLLDNYLKDNWQAYYDGTLPESEMKVVLTTLQKVNDRYYILNDLSDYQTYFAEISLSRANYEKGVKLAEEGKYMEAAAAFEQVDPVDATNYVSAQEKAQEARIKYKNDIMDKARALVKEKKYSDAFNLVLSAEEMYFYGDPEMTDYLLEINTLLVADEMQQSFDAKNYVEVINRYEHALTADWGINPTADMTEQYTNSISIFMNHVTTDAKAAFGSSKDYEAAIAVVRSAITEAYYNEGLLAKLEALITEYQAYIPVKLSSLKYTQNYSLSIEWTEKNNYTDVNGKEYDPTNILATKNTDNDSDATNEAFNYRIYNLNYKYSLFTGTVFRPYGSLTHSDWKNKQGIVRIYGDDVLLKEFAPLTKDSYDTYDFQIDVSGVRNLKIVILGCLHDYSSGGHDHPLAAIGDPMLQK